MGQASSRVQFLDFKLLRSGQFSPGELALLQYVNSYSTEYTAPRNETMRVIAESLSRSVRTIKRWVKALCEKGIIVRRYGQYKRLILQLVTLEKQKLLRNGGVVKHRLSKLLKRKKKIPIGPSVSQDYGPSVSQPIKKETFKEIKHNKDSFTEIKSLGREGLGISNNAINEARAKYMAHIGKTKYI